MFVRFHMGEMSSKIFFALLFGIIPRIFFIDKFKTVISKLFPTCKCIFIQKYCSTNFYIMDCIRITLLLSNFSLNENLTVVFYWHPTYHLSTPLDLSYLSFCFHRHHLTPLQLFLIPPRFLTSGFASGCSSMLPMPHRYSGTCVMSTCQNTEDPLCPVCMVEEQTAKDIWLRFGYFKSVSLLAILVSLTLWTLWQMFELGGCITCSSLF